MSKETALSLVRTLLTLVGTIVIGHKIMGHTISSDIWETILGAASTITGIVTGIVSKTATIEAVESGIRSVFIALGGLAVAAGWLKNDQLLALIGFIAPAMAALHSYISRQKNKQIASGALTPCADSGKADPAGPKIK